MTAEVSRTSATVSGEATSPWTLKVSSSGVLDKLCIPSRIFNLYLDHLGFACSLTPDRYEDFALLFWQYLSLKVYQLVGTTLHIAWEGLAQTLHFPAPRIQRPPLQLWFAARRTCLHPCSHHLHCDRVMMSLSPLSGLQLPWGHRLWFTLP